MTKTDLLAGPVRWYYVSDLYLAVDDDHSVNQELDQSPSLLEGCPRQALAHSLAEVVNAGGEPGEFLLTYLLTLPWRVERIRVPAVRKLR